MDSRLLSYYNTELQHIREIGGEFAEAFPKVAGRLGLESFECADPYVERLLEGFAFLAARVHLRLDAEFPRLTQHLLDVVYPDYLCPRPSMAIAGFAPDWQQGSLNEGYTIPRSTALRGQLGRGDQTACEYRTAHDVQLWPVEIVEAGYYSRDASAISLPPEVRNVRAALRLRMRTHGGIKFNQLPLDRLPIYIDGSEQLPMSVYELIMANASAVIVQSVDSSRTHRILPRSAVQPYGFAPEQSLLPYTSRSFDGYRLLEEYFAFSSRFMYFELAGLNAALRKAATDQIDVIIALSSANPWLDGRVAAENFVLYTSPAINLFPKVADRIHVNQRQEQFQVIPDRTRHQDLEVYRVEQVTGYGVHSKEAQAFRPLYASYDRTADANDGYEERAYFTVQREPRLLSQKQQRTGPRSSYIGNEVYLSLVDANEAPFRGDLRQLRVETLCTNRDLSLQLPVGVGATDFTLSIGAPVENVRCISGPTAPQPSRASDPGTLTWKLVHSLSLNYLSLTEHSDGRGAEALRDLLRLCVGPHDVVMMRHVEGVSRIQSTPIVRRLPRAGPLTFGRGIQIQLTLDESHFDGSGPYLLGAVLEQFFAKYVSLNSFTETRLASSIRGDIAKWPARIGRRQIM